ncbi:TPA: hypothetical protein L9L30_004150 [Klebsiella quasipneumoniae subsp. quasipneumoniae]|nr:hypothetical protein [Klebsiella quasipneumoniae subsp. quasipneumoniae]
MINSVIQNARTYAQVNESVKTDNSQNNAVVKSAFNIIILAYF